MKKLAGSTLLLSILLFSGCAEPEVEQLEGYGLEPVQVYIEPSRLNRLHNEIRRKPRVAAKIFHRSRYYPAWLRPTGQSGLFGAKRSYEMSMQSKAFLGAKYYRLNAQISDLTALKSALGFYILQEHGLMTSSNQPVVAYMNDRLLGLYHLFEVVDADFFSNRNVSIGNLYRSRFARLNYGSLKPFTIADLRKGFSRKIGPKGFADLRRLILTVHDDAPKGRTDRIEKILNVENYFQYLSAAAFLHHQDGYTNNFFLYTDKTTGRFNFVPWDLDRIYENGPNVSTQSVLVFGRGGLSEALMEIPPYKQAYLEIFEELCTTTMPWSKIESFIDDFAETIQEAWEADPLLSRLDKNFQEHKQELKDSVQAWTTTVCTQVQAQIQSF